MALCALWLVAVVTTVLGSTGGAQGLQGGAVEKRGQLESCGLDVSAQYRLSVSGETSLCL